MVTYDEPFLSNDELAAVEAAALIALRERLKRRKRFIQNNPELSKRLGEINRKLFELSILIEELNDEDIHSN
jgi:hypothetical protein